MDNNSKRQFEALLLGLRDDLLRRRGEIDRSWQNLHEPEIEFEERAANEHLASALDMLDEQDERNIEYIDRALSRLQENVYDICESCGGTIAEKRLEAVPWTTRCVDCAARTGAGEEAGIPLAAAAAGGPELPPEMQGMSDEQLRMAVIDAIRRDGRIPAEELTVTCRDRVVRLEGLLPDERHLNHLREVVNDVLGLRDVEENIRIDRTAWARMDRTSGRETGGRLATDSSAGEGTETIDAVKEGKSIAPADEIIPEKKK